MLRSRARVICDHQGRAARGEDAFATPRRTASSMSSGERRGRGPHPARGHGGDRSAMPATSSACRCRPIARSAAAAKAVRACRRARRISSRGCSSPRPIRRCCSFPRTARSTRTRSGGCRSRRRNARGKALVNMLPLDAGRADHHDHAVAGGRGELGHARRHVRDHARQRPAQQAVRLRPGQPRRQDRHEARRGRGNRRRRRSAARPTMCC